MRIGDVLWFAPPFRFLDLDPADADGFIEALSDRLKGFYLDPAAGLLCCAAIDPRTESESSRIVSARARADRPGQRHR